MKTKPTSPRSSSVARKLRHPERDRVDAAPAPISIQTSFRHMSASPAVAARIEAEVDKLRKYFERITYCHVVVVAPHRHHRIGRRYSLHVELGVPRGRLVITHEPPARTARVPVERASKQDEWDAAHKDIYVSIRDAFAAARRQLKEYVRRLRGEVKEHRREPRTGAVAHPA